MPESTGIKIGEQKIQMLGFADDLKTLGNSLIDIKNQVKS